MPFDMVRVTTAGAHGVGGAADPDQIPSRNTTIAVSHDIPNEEALAFVSMPTAETALYASARVSNDPIAAQLQARLTSTGKEPGVPTDDAVTYKRVEGEAFRTKDGRTVDPTVADVDQGGLGDCYLMGAMAAVAKTDPNLLRNMISKNDDGTYTVRLRVKEGGKWKTVPVNVTPTFPHNSDGKHSYADPTPGNQNNTLWPALIEKAYAQYKGGYDKIEGGNSGRAMEFITGRSSRNTSIGSTTDPNDIYDKVKAAERGGHPMTLSTKDGATDYPGDHAYAVLGAVERDGKKYIRIYNPWGVNDGSRKLEDSIYEVPLDKLRANFDSLKINDA